MREGNTKKALRAARDVTLTNTVSQRLLQYAAERRLLPAAFFTHVDPVGVHPVRTPAQRSIRYVGDPSDPVGRLFVWRLGWEASSLAAWSEMCQTSSSVVDVGAYTGIYSLVAAADSGARVVAVEPNPGVLPHLHRNISINGFDESITVVQGAVGAHAGAALLHLPPDPTMASIRADPSAPTVQVPLLRLDDVAPDDTMAVKVDVEGAEGDVLVGAAGLLSSNHPELILEVLGAEQFGLVVDLLAAHGYGTPDHLGASGATATKIFIPDRWHYNYRWRAR